MSYTDEEKKIIGGRLQIIRKLRKLTQTDLAEELSKRGIKKTQTDIAKYETGIFVPRKKTLKAICDVLRFNQNYILYGMEPYLTVKKNPVGREYLLKTVNYDDETIRTSLIELDEPTREIRSPKYMLRVLSQDYLDHFKEICADDSWDKEDLAAVYSFIEFIKYRHEVATKDDPADDIVSDFYDIYKKE